MEACENVFAPLANQIQLLFPLPVWNDISPRFLCTFWSLQTYDIYIPNDSYDKEMDKLRKTVQNAEENRDLVKNFLMILDC